MVLSLGTAVDFVVVLMATRNAAVGCIKLFKLKFASSLLLGPAGCVCRCCGDGRSLFTLSSVVVTVKVAIVDDDWLNSYGFASKNSPSTVAVVAMLALLLRAMLLTWSLSVKLAQINDDSVLLVEGNEEDENDDVKLQPALDEPPTAIEEAKSCKMSCGNLLADATRLVE